MLDLLGNGTQQPAASSLPSSFTPPPMGMAAASVMMPWYNQQTGKTVSTPSSGYTTNDTNWVQGTLPPNWSAPSLSQPSLQSPLSQGTNMATNDVGIGLFEQNQFNPNASPLATAAATPAPAPAAPGPTFNAATGPNLTAAPSNYVTPPQLGTPSTPTGGSFTQGAALPNITTTQQQATAAPAWYMDYLNNLAGTSTQAGANAQYVGAQPLQQQAFNQTSANVGNYQPNLASANALTMNAATTGAPQLAQSYMNPYIGSVVDEAGRLGLQNIRNTISPQATAGAVGSGQFGSTRGANVLGQNVTNALQTLGGQQQGLLASGYQNAMTAAQADLARQMTGGSQMGALGTTTQNLGMGDVNALSTMGGQQQQMAQNQQLFPLQVAAQQAALMKGFTIPTSVSSTYTGPIPGAYQTSPLTQLGSLGAGLMGGFTTPAGGGKSPLENFFGQLGKLFPDTPPINPSSGNYGDLPQTGDDSYLAG